MVLGISTWPISDTVLPTLLEVVIQDFLPQSFRLGSRSTHIYIYMFIFFSLNHNGSLFEISCFTCA